MRADLHTIYDILYLVDIRACSSLSFPHLRACMCMYICHMHACKCDCVCVCMYRRPLIVRLSFVPIFTNKRSHLRSPRGTRVISPSSSNLHLLRELKFTSKYISELVELYIPNVNLVYTSHGIQPPLLARCHSFTYDRSFQTTRFWSQDYTGCFNRQTCPFNSS